jgi:SAM-dependent methyltransferase
MNRPIAYDAYEQLADSFAAKVDTKPHNAYYERPATLSLLPDVAGIHVLDVGCGPGAYAEWLLDRGARVTAIDASPSMVAHATQRTGGRADVRVADVSVPLAFLDDASVQLVLCPLVLEYVADWVPVMQEFRRVLVPGGSLVVSVTHPTADYTYYNSRRYFDVEQVSAEWTGFGGRVRVPSYRRSLQETLMPFLKAGFQLSRVLEPLPTEAFREADARHYEELMQFPAFLCISAVSPG